MIERMIITDYYNGAIGGFVRCPVCSAVYHFVTLDWSESHLNRVIALSLLPADSMTRIVSFFSEEPAAGKWIPQRMQRASDEDLDQINAFLSDMTQRAEPPSILLVWNIKTDEVLAARNVGCIAPEDSVSMFDFDAPAGRKDHDWFAELDVPRQS
jgi:hypothetical protein